METFYLVSERLNMEQAGASSHGGMEANASIFGLGGIFFRLGDVKISLRGDFSMTQGGMPPWPRGDRRPWEQAFYLCWHGNNEKLMNHISPPMKLYCNSSTWCLHYSEPEFHSIRGTTTFATDEEIKWQLDLWMALSRSESQGDNPDRWRRIKVKG